MKNRVRLSRAVAISILALIGLQATPVFAWPAEGEGTFHAANAGDIPYISGGGYAVTNLDTGSGRSVIASLGYYSTTVNFTYYFHVDAYDNGGPLTCYVAGVTDSSSSSLLQQATKSVVGITGLDFTVPVTPGNWFLNLYCTIPPNNPNSTPSFLYGWTEEFKLD